MSNPLDALIPPRQTDFALVPLPEPEVEESDGFENYMFDTHMRAWVCNECEALVANPPGHTAWHEHLDKKTTPQ